MDNNYTFDLGKSLWYRFLRGAVAGAASTGATVTVALATAGVKTWQDLGAFLTVVGVSLIAGAVSGVFLAVDKFVRS